ncbi:amino acid permease [Corynebacterium heidelbergense]|uniref:Amino acid transporter n=1 Tax=Corynebacterium heidelbergense TaxID=2055947 RepID=A0A364V6E8_9CORY|nr:amino acid permease [Corynebacterium heidelbergense]RAV32176.1 amino acid transporter [Corynebacterium heidelbergense]
MSTPASPSPHSSGAPPSSGANGTPAATPGTRTTDTTTVDTAGAPGRSTADSGGLGHGLKTRHLTMMGLGSAIGAGLFLGTGVGIRAAGPAVLLSYVVAGILVIFVMRMLGEMAAARPASGSFATYGRQAFGHWAGFSMGWLYWFMLIMVMGAEITGAGNIMGRWFGVEGWIPGLVAVVFFTVVNLAAVRGFGEFEYWFAFIKIAVIVAFLLIAAGLLLGLFPNYSSPGLSNFHPFAPKGLSGIATGLLAVAFAFGGIEIITIAAAESEHPSESITTAVRAVVWRISVFYLGAVFFIAALLPFETLGKAESAAESPFTRVLQLANVPGVVMGMEIIIVLALLSAFNAQIYATSRLTYSFAKTGYAPKIFRRVNSQQVPVYAVLGSLVFAFLSVALQVWGPANLITILFNAVGGTLLLIWAVITLSAIRLRPHLVAEGSLKVRMWGYPWLPWITLAMIGGLAALMLWDPEARMQVVTVAVVAVVLSAIGVVVGNRKGVGEDATLGARV